MIEIDVVAGRGDWSAAGDMEAMARRCAEAVFSVLPEAHEVHSEIGILVTDDAGIR